MGRKRRRKPKSYRDQMLSICNSVQPFQDRIVALFRSVDWTSQSWRRDVLRLSRVYGAMVQALLAISPPAEHVERHVALTRGTRNLADALENIAALVVDDSADFDVEAAKETLRTVTTGCVAQSLTAAKLQQALKETPDDTILSESPPIVA